MRNAWLKKFAAALAALGLTGSSVVASPAGMAVRSGPSPQSPVAYLASKPSTTSTPTTSTTAEVNATAVGVVQAEPLRPSAQFSPVKNPFKYFAAAMSELPIGPKSLTSAKPVLPSKPQYNDSIALDTPVGPPTPEWYISLAQVSERQGNIQQARSQYGKALATWPGHAEVLRAAARMEDRLGELGMAETLYQQAVAANPQHAGALNDLGLCLARQGKLDASLQMIEQAVNLQPQKALYRNNAATVLVEMRQDQRALGHLAAVHGSADANYNLGQLLVQRGRAADATPYFQAAVAQNPQMQSAHVALAKLQGTTVPSPAPTQSVAPAASPTVVPQQAPAAGPQLYYPATARSPEFGASTYVPPGYYAPQGYGPAPRAPMNPGTPTHYLPPVASQPGAMQRR